MINFGEFYLTKDYNDGDTSIQVVSRHQYYTLRKRVKNQNLEKGTLFLRSKDDTEKFMRVRYDGVTETGLLNGKQRYSLDIAKADDNSTLMVGLSNDDDGTNNLANVIPELAIDYIPEDSIANITVGAHDLLSLVEEYESARDAYEKNQKSIVLAETKRRLAFQERQNQAYKGFTEQETAARTSFEGSIDTKIDDFISNGTEIDGVVSRENASDGELSAEYQNKGAQKITFHSGDVLFVVVIDQYVEEGVDGVAKILDSDGTTVVKTITKNKDTAKVVIS